MRRESVVIVLLALCLLGGCSRVAEETPSLDMLFIDRPALRVGLDESGHTKWQGGDEVSVFYRSLENENWQYQPFFKGDVLCHTHGARTETTSRIVALYPYSAGNSLSDNTLLTQVPAEQELVLNSFGRGAALMTAVTSGTSLHFKYACAMIALRLELTGQVESLSLSGGNSEVLAGPAVIDISGETPVLSLLRSASATSIDLTAAEPVAVDGVSEFLFCVPPMTFSSGVRATIRFANGSEKPVIWEDPFSVAAGHVAVLSWAGDAAGTIDLVLDFSNGNDPFDVLATTDTLKALPNYTNAHPDYTFYFTHQGVHYPFTMHAEYYAGGYGMGIGAPSGSSVKDFQLGRGGSWISIPPMEGKTLYSISYVAGSTSGHPVLCADPAGENRVSTQVGATVVGEEYTMLAFLTEPGQTYYMYMTSPNNYLHARRITIRYK